MASIQLRALIDSILTDISRDMREQADVVETEFARRISEMSDAMQKMIHNMREVSIWCQWLGKNCRDLFALDIKSDCRKWEENW